MATTFEVAGSTATTWPTDRSAIHSRPSGPTAMPQGDPLSDTWSTMVFVVGSMWARRDGLFPVTQIASLVAAIAHGFTTPSMVATSRVPRGAEAGSVGRGVRVGRGVGEAGVDAAGVAEVAAFDAVGAGPVGVAVVEPA